MLSENDGDCQERISRRVEFKTSYSVESLTSGSSDGESYSPRLPHVRRRDSLLQRTKSFSQIIHEMGSNTKKLEEEMYGLLRDMVSFYFNKNLELFCCHIRLLVPKHSVMSLIIAALRGESRVRLLPERIFLLHFYFWNDFD